MVGTTLGTTVVGVRAGRDPVVVMETDEADPALELEPFGVEVLWGDVRRAAPPTASTATAAAEVASISFERRSGVGPSPASQAVHCFPSCSHPFIGLPFSRCPGTATISEGANRQHELPRSLHAPPGASQAGWLQFANSGSRRHQTRSHQHVKISPGVRLLPFVRSPVTDRDGAFGDWPGFGASRAHYESRMHR